MKKQYRCWAEVDLEALRGNVAWIRQRVGPRIKLLTVVKADAYGHGLKQIAALLMQSGTDIFGVANLQEAHAIRSVGQGWPILMLGACLPEEIDRAVRDDVRPTLSSFEEAQAFSQAATHLNRTVYAHVKLDTGMGRLGLEVSSAPACIEAMRRLPHLQLEGIYTHYASAEDDPAYSRRQAQRFTGVLEKLKERGIEFPLVHANNSAAVLHQPGTTGNLVRPGLLVYGIVPTGRRRWNRAEAGPVRPALVLKSRISLVKSVPRGTRLSYGGTYRASRTVRVATVTAGYGDGYLRAAGEKGCVLVGGRRCSILGRITMDQMLVDVSEVGPILAGDEVVMIGSQGDESITASEVASWAGTIPWEVLTAITYRVPRVYRGSQAA